MVREQLGFALNRVGERAEAEKVLAEVIREFGPSSETNGLLGRVYKDHVGGGEEGRPRHGGARPPQARHRQLPGRLRGRLARRLSRRQCGDADGAVGAARPGARRSCCRSCATPATQRIRGDEHGTGDYWDQATLVELAVIGTRPRRRRWTLPRTALAVVTEPWQPATTARNLRLIREAREARGEDAAWIAEIEQALARPRPG